MLALGAERDVVRHRADRPSESEPTRAERYGWSLINEPRDSVPGQCRCSAGSVPVQVPMRPVGAVHPSEDVAERVDDGGRRESAAAFGRRSVYLRATGGERTRLPLYL